MTSSLVEKMANLDEDGVLLLVRQGLERGTPVLDLVEECRRGLFLVGERYAAQRYYLTDLIMSSEIFKQAMQLLEPPLVAAARPLALPPVVFGTAKSDIHDIGKNITISLLRCSGFPVTDLGVDVEPERFAAALRDTEAPILCISALLTPAFEHIKRTIDLMASDGLRSRTTVIIGGLVSRRVCEQVGADYWVKDASEGVAKCKRLAAGRRRSTRQKGH